ncbi:MAG: pantetheine-phosphate adenylyltransferase [Chloroflexota bacterium]|nr:pantetheine-phosphate adenylyltransferase [Chloroflexota bacterium]
MPVAVYPGGFDPVTNGHLDIVARAATLFDQVIVAVYPRGANDLFSLEERVAMFAEATAGMPNVRVEGFSGLVVSYARSVGATVLVRGMRAVTDFEAELDMALMNKKMAPEVESVYLITSLEHLFISASRIREIASLGHSVTDLVPPNVARALAERFGEAVDG